MCTAAQLASLCVIPWQYRHPMCASISCQVQRMCVVRVPCQFLFLFCYPDNPQQPLINHCMLALLPAKT